MILEKVRRTIKNFDLLRNGERIVVGVSGGPDSVSLLYLLFALRRQFKLSLYIAHLDHGLRKDSQKDRKFVQDLGRKLSLPVITERAELKLNSVGGSLEQIARDARFDFFFRAAKNFKAGKIALGHNLDDQAETVLMRVLRGAGLYGLSAILPKRKIRGFTVIRPLIEVRRGEIEAFLRRKKLRCRRDSSNQQEIYLRNRLRNRLLPLLEKQYNRNIKAMLGNLAQSSALDYAYLNQAAERFMRHRRSKIPLKDFLRLHPAIQRLVLRLNISRLKGDTRGISFAHILEIEDLVSSRPQGSIVDLPKGISVIKKRKSLVFFRR